MLRRTCQDVPWTPGLDLWWHEVVGVPSTEHVVQLFEAEHPLFIVYTSDTTGRPKGLVYTSGGYLTHASWAHFDAKGDDVHLCTADLA